MLFSYSLLLSLIQHQGIMFMYINMTKGYPFVRPFCCIEYAIHLLCCPVFFVKLSSFFRKTVKKQDLRAGLVFCFCWLFAFYSVTKGSRAI